MELLALKKGLERAVQFKKVIRWILLREEICKGRKNGKEWRQTVLNHMKLTTIIQPLFSKYYSIHEVKAKYQSRKGTQQVKNLPAMQEIQEMRV